MSRVRSQFVQHVVVAITLVLILGALSMIWPGIIAVSLGVLLLLQSLSDSQEIALLSWAESGNVPMVLSSLRGPGPLRLL